MKRITLLALSATVAMAQAPAAAPAAAPVATATASTAPLAPIHDDLIYGNPALPSSIGYLLITPSDFYGKRQAAFQWGGASTTNFSGTGLAVIDRFFAGFNSNGSLGELAGGYITPAFGIGAKLSVQKTGYFNEEAAAVGTTPTAANTKSHDSTFAATGFGVFGSAPVNDLTVYGRLYWGSPVSYGSTDYKTTTGTETVSSRSDSLDLGVGAYSPAKGDNGLSWFATFDYTNSSTRHSLETSDDAGSTHEFVLLGGLGQSFSSNGFSLVPGLNGGLLYANGKSNPDWEYMVFVQPTVSTILPVFERWFVKGGTGLVIGYDRGDDVVGEPEVINSSLVSVTPTANVGLRYERGRWAAEAQVANGFLNKGPNFISGQSGDLFASFAITANFK